jgi:4-hydroxybenzoate polyprenyltransferase
MRGAGCIINDIIDCRFDAQIERTRNRPLPSNQISIRQAFIFLVALLTVGFLILIHLNRITIYFGFISLLFVFTYPVMKRITWWPQAFLGLTFNCGALLGWTAVTGDFSWTAVVLYVAGLFWTLGYDTIYAHQDKIGDELIGIKSTARLFGRSSPVWVAIFYTIAILGLILTGVLVGLHPIHLLVLALAGLQLSWQVIQWSIDDPNDCLAKFESNKWFGLLVLVSFILGRVAKNALL